MDLRAYLIINRYSQRELARKCGVHHSFLSMMVNGRRNLTMKMAKKIEEATNGELSVELLFNLYKETTKTFVSKRTKRK